MRKQRTVVYVDGFNLYYCSLRRTPYKWLDLERLCRNILNPDAHEILKIKFFSAGLPASTKPYNWRADQGGNC